MILKAERNAFASPGMAGAGEVRTIFALAVFAGLAFFFAFWTWPDLDREALRLFWREEEGFFLRNNDEIALLRQAMFLSIGIFYTLVGIGWFAAFVRQSQWLWLTWEKWCYLGACGIAGPALLVNGVLKAHWGRGRPRDVEEFGGALGYTDFWEWSDQCVKNCSFTSGEVAAVAMILFSLAFVLTRPARWMVFGLAVASGFGAAWMRMTAGAHFLSDTLYSIVFMAMIAAALYALFFLRDGAWIEKANKQQRAKLGAKG